MPDRCIAYNGGYGRNVVFHDSIYVFRSQVYRHSVWQAKTAECHSNTEKINKPLIMPKYINIEKYAHIVMVNRHHRNIRRQF